MSNFLATKKKKKAIQHDDDDEESSSSSSSASTSTTSSSSSSSSTSVTSSGTTKGTRNSATMASTTLKSPRGGAATSTAIGGGAQQSSRYSLDMFQAVETQEVLGSIDIVRHVQTKKLYALKVIEKPETIRLDLVGDAEAERSILQTLERRDCVVKLLDSFVDERRAYLVLDLVGGGSLKDHLAANGAFDEKVALFYTAELLLALESIHEAKVAHGMLASEHVLLNTDGHVVLASFSGAARQERSAPSRNRARIMPHCAAPERFRNTGATPAADFWSLGCLIYEMLTGAPLFLFDSAYTTAEAVASVDTAHVASKLEPTAARDVVRHLLVVDASKRDDGAALRNCKWLRNVDWKVAEARSGRGPLAKQATAFADALNSAEDEKKNMRPSYGAPFDVANKIFSNF